ncbi:MAG TPA: heat-inducible transcriptional repressor HrcA [Candidatus Limnocylindrales bacterium]|jgi:heat-inducible transcriptional repressor|nr:heat-inducible transcriptional repressor HrcA [Candidatus Limnocylindrales bacterium]
MARRKQRAAGPLDLRSAAILRAVIEEYVSTAMPVGSQTLVDRHRLSVSSATVRNVMADLERGGLLAHPHTSAGRVPTDAGYRSYVESIGEAVTLAPVQQLMIRHQFGQVEYASEQWFRLAAATLAGLTRAAGWATPAKPVRSRVKRIDLLAAGELIVSIVLVLAEGPVKQALVGVDEPLDQERLDAVAQALNARLEGKTTPEVGRIAEGDRRDRPADRLAAAAVERIHGLMRDYDAALVEDVFSEGLLNVMEQPEFDRSEKLRSVFRALQDRDYLGQLLGEIAGSGAVHVYIGSENPPLELREVSLVVAPYGRPGRAMGVIGVLGPRRMAYPHAISTVRFVSGLMNELVDHLYA